MIFFELFYTFFLIGLFTFGGGYAMIPLIQNMVISKGWITEDALTNFIAISESTPGPISVNAATYIGFKVAGFWGSFFATLGLAIPSFVIIFVISFFYQDFMKWPVITAMFKGLKIGVIILLFSAVLRLRKGVKVNLVGTILFVSTLSIMLVFSFIDIGFKYLSLSLILLGIITGIVLTLITNKKEGSK